jgi:hypothetical protein
MKKLLMIAACAAVLASPAWAIDGLNKPLTDEAGNPAPDIQAPDEKGECTFEQPGQPAKRVRCMRARDAMFHALLFGFPDESQLSGEDKYKRGVLAGRIHDVNGDSLPLVTDEVQTIKKVVGKLYSPWYVRQVYDVVDPPK